MLWVDQNFVSVNDLLYVDSEIVELAGNESLNLDELILRGKEDAQARLNVFMTFSDLHTSDLALRNINRPGFWDNTAQNALGWAQLVVTGATASQWSALKSWVVDVTLKRIYTAATNRKADRYDNRLDAVKERIKNESWPWVKRFGLPIILSPLPAPGAVMERAGSFGSSNLSLVDGSGTMTAEVDVAITWTDANFADNGESHPSTRVTVTLEADKLLKVSLGDLVAPDGSQPLHTQSESTYATRIATGWRVYVGTLGGTLYLQNETPVPIATTEYTLSADPVFSGTPVGLGQYSDLILEINPGEIRRG